MNRRTPAQVSADAEHPARSGIDPPNAISMEAAMDQDPKNYRDPKVTTDTTHRATTTRRTGSSTSWLWIAVAVVVGLLLLAWLFGWTGTDRVATVPVDDDVVVEEVEPVTGTTGAAIEGAAEETGEAVGGAVDATGDALEGAAEEAGEALGETGQAIEGAAEETGDTIDITPDAEVPAVDGEVETQTVPIEPAD
jgi:hypothetical protein